MAAGKHCAYCGVAADTRDHVPPRCFFPKPYPKDLITVPSCRSCNGGSSADEEYLVLAVVAEACDDNPQALEVLRQRAPAILTPGRQRLARRLLRSTQTVDERTAAGVVIGRTNRLALEVDRTNRVLQKIVRGLHFHQFGERIPESMEVVPEISPSGDTWGHPLFQTLLKQPKVRKGEAVFEYTSWAPSDTPSRVWAMLFYGRTPAIAYVVPTGTVDRLRETPSRKGGRGGGITMQ